MVATLRRKGEPPPVYGVDSDDFTLEVHHGGFFVGQGSNRAYIDEKLNWFDYVEADTWSPLWLEELHFKLHYPKNPSLKVYWLLPGRDLSDGLRVIVSDEDTLVMSSLVHKVKNFVLYMDHDDNISVLNWEDIVTNPMSSLPKVLSPTKKTQDEQLPSFYSNLRRVAPENQGLSSGSEDGSSEDGSDFCDSDYEVGGDDDDLFVDNVDEQVIDQGVAKGKKIAKGRKKCARKNVEDELELPHREEDDELRLRFKSFRSEDASQTSSFNLVATPLPDSAFISSNVPTTRPVPPTTATKGGRAKASKRKASKGDHGPAKKTKKTSSQAKKK